MEEEQIQSIILDNQTENQYQLSPIAAHVHNGADSLRIDFNNLQNKTRFILYRIVPSDQNTAIGNITGGDLVMPFAGFVSLVGATVDTAGTTNTTTVDINKNGSSILKTKVTIDSAKKTSRTAAIPSIINAAVRFFSTGDIFTFDIDAVNTTPAKGLTMFLNVTQTP